MATTWNPSDKNAGITLSGGNLIATYTGGLSSVRAAASKTSGKYYWEITVTTSGSNAAYGLVTGNFPLGQHFAGGGSSIGCVGVNSTGAITVNNSSSGQPNIPAIVNGDILCFAIDLTAGRFWVRRGAAGVWNGSVPGDPAAGTVGIAMPFGSTLAAYPAWYAQNTSTITANFGDSAFAGTVPSGFTAGFPIGVAPLVGAATQIALEQWSQGAPEAQLTQVAIEEWATLAVANPLAVVTQVSLEQWAVVTAAAAVAEQYAVTVIT
jgi:hypothetical protein